MDARGRRPGCAGTTGARSSPTASAGT
ncbi:TPA_asm: UL15 iORF 1 [Human alphaherpesvirus 1]|nr:TPA_asm: UL15 iORF 1 [Human alphaherpesvirus 1]